MMRMWLNQNTNLCLENLVVGNDFYKMNPKMNLNETEDMLLTEAEIDLNFLFNCIIHKVFDIF